MLIPSQIADFSYRSNVIVAVGYYMYKTLSLLIFRSELLRPCIVNAGRSRDLVVSVTMDCVVDVSK